MHPTDYAERNRAAWNQVAPIHREHRATDLRAAVRDAAFSTLDAVERDVYARIGVAGKRVAQLCCNNGRELISVVRLGADAGVGFDISDGAVAEARVLASLAHADCEFVRTNIYDIDPADCGRFDLVFTTIGALCWFDDLDRLMRVVASLLRDGGHLFVYEAHPVLDLFALPGEEDFDAQNELKVAYSYFKDTPFISTNGLDYVGHTQYESPPTYSFPHTVAATISAVLQSGLTLREYQEHPHDITSEFAFLEKYGMLPMCYTLVAQK